MLLAFVLCICRVVLGVVQRATIYLCLHEPHTAECICTVRAPYCDSTGIVQTVMYALVLFTACLTLSWMSGIALRDCRAASWSLKTAISLALGQSLASGRDSTNLCLNVHLRSANVKRCPPYVKRCLPIVYFIFGRLALITSARFML